MIDPKEELRLEAVKQYLKQFPGIKDKLQDIVSLASQITGVPIAFITILEKEIQHFPVTYGYEIEVMPRETSFCTHAIKQDEILVIPNTLEDERFVNNPLVTHDPSLRYYAGISLKSTEGLNIGTLCVMDTKSHSLSQQQLDSLKALSRQVTTILEFSLTVDHLRQTVNQVETRNIALRKIAYVQSHEIREPLTSVMGVMNILKSDDGENFSTYLKYLESAVNRLDEKIKTIVNVSSTAYYN